MEIEELINIITDYITQTYSNNTPDTKYVIKDKNSKDNELQALTIFAPNGHIIFVTITQII